MPKYVFSFLLAILITLLVLLYQLPPSYTYKGIAQTTLPQANELLQEMGGNKNIEVFAYNAKQDKIYVAYNFIGSQEDTQRYGIPEGTASSKITLGFILGALGTLITFGFAVSLWVEYFRSDKHDE